MSAAFLIRSQSERSPSEQVKPTREKLRGQVVEENKPPAGEP